MLLVYILSLVYRLLRRMIDKNFRYFHTQIKLDFQPTGNYDQHNLVFLYILLLFKNYVIRNLKITKLPVLKKEVFTSLTRLLVHSKDHMMTAMRNATYIGTDFSTSALDCEFQTFDIITSLSQLNVYKPTFI